MRSVRGPVVFCFLAGTIAIGSFGETVQLNPTVTVLPKAQSLPATDCDVGLAPAAPRAVQADVTADEAAPSVTVTNLPPASGDLRTHLRAIQSAAENEDYQSFKTALTDARTAISGYPGGGERQAAEEALRVYSDLERLWDYAYNSPTGAFFDETTQNGAIVSMMRRYSAFPRGVADATLRVDGQTLYPSRETRLLLVEEANRRLTRLGVRTPSRVTIEQPVPRTRRTQRIITTEPMPAPRTARRTTTPSRKSGTRKSSQPSRSSTTVHRTPRRSTQIAEATPPKRTPRRTQEPVVTPVPMPKQAPVPLPTPVPEPPTTTESIPPNIAPEPTPTTTTQSATTATEMTDTTPATTTTAATSTTTSTTTTSAEKPAQARGGMNLTFAIILIVIGIGVLIVLFRASD